MSVCKEKVFIGQEFSSKRDSKIPDEYIIHVNFSSLRFIARRQIISLLERRHLTKNYCLYNREINRVILYECLHTYNIDFAKLLKKIVD